MVSKNQQKIGEANGMPCLQFVPTQVTLRGNMGSLDAPRASHLSTFGPNRQGISLRGSLMVSKNQQKIREANGMISLPIMPKQVALRGNVSSLDPRRAAHLSTFYPRVQDISLRGS